MVVGATAAIAKSSPRPPANIDASYAALLKTLAGANVPHGSGVITQLHGNLASGAAPPAVWHYIDALYCGWENSNGSLYFYVTDGNATLWDVTDDHMLATAMAIPCVHGYQLWYRYIGHNTFDETESATYP